MDKIAAALMWNLLAAVGCGILIGSPATALDYTVGPGQAMETIGEVPWASLSPGDRVLIHWRSDPYREKWVINRRGLPDAWISILGVPGPAGQRPVIDGRDAITAPGLNFWNDERGLIKIGGSSVPADGLPAYIRIEGLELRSARPPYAFTDDGGTQRTYVSNAASIYIEKAEHLIIRDCVIHDSGNGIFSGSFGGLTRELLIEQNHLFGNGNVGSVFHHNSYTAAVGITYQYNRFGALRAGADGNNLKDRSAGLVVRYNWIEDGNRQLDLVDGESPVAGDPAYAATLVYGNVLIEDEGQGNSQVVHYGGDGGDVGLYRKGWLYFYNNTVVSTRTGNTTLLRLSTAAESADVRNNILYVAAGGERLAMLDSSGSLALRNNWLRPGWKASHGTLAGTIDDDGSGLLGDDPGFLDLSSQSLRPGLGATVIDAGTQIHPIAASHPVLRHYLRHQMQEARPVDTVLDIGAYEHCPVACGAFFGDGFEAGNTGAWQAAMP